MRIVLVSRFPLADIRGWKQQLAGALLDGGHELLLLYSRKAVRDHLAFGLDYLERRRQASAAEERRSPSAREGDLEGAGSSAGRARRRLSMLRPPTLARWARREGVPVSRHGRLSDPGCAAAVESFEPDLGILLGADLVPARIIELPHIGMLNAHYGLLPAYRGMNVAEWSVYNGDPVGVSIHWVDPGVDTGAILVTEKIPVRRGDTLADLRARQQSAAARLLGVAVAEIEAGTAQRSPQRFEEGRQYFRMHPVLLRRAVEKLSRGEYPHLTEDRPGRRSTRPGGSV